MFGHLMCQKEGGGWALEMSRGGGLFGHVMCADQNEERRTRGWIAYITNAV